MEQKTKAAIDELRADIGSNEVLLRKAIRVIKKAKSKGIDRNEVVAFLKEQGFTDADINAAFDSYQSRTDTVELQEGTAPLSDNERGLADVINYGSLSDADHDHSKPQHHVADSGYFEWKDVNVTIQGKHILHGISGRVHSGQLLGILGGSGAGKTTLLNSISGRLLSKRASTVRNSVCCLQRCKDRGIQVTGSVAYKGSEYKLGHSDSIKYISAYVMQHDIMCPTATASETLRFSSKLRSTKSVEEQQEIIEHVIQSLKLDDCKDTRIGNEAIRGMSGGEKKRTSVGMELVVEPELIFLDEPTSGLDSFTALKTLEILKNLTAKENKQVVATVHQPSSEIFDMIDILVLLAKGNVVYFGAADKVVDYFASIGYRCPQYTNIADFVVNRVQENSAFFIEEWKKHEKRYIDLDFNGYDTLKPKKKQAASFCAQFAAVLHREFQILARDPRPSKIRLLQTCVFALIVGLLYWDLPYTAEGLRDRFGAVFFLAINSSMTGLISTIIVFPEQRLLFERERDGNMYYTTTWLMAKGLVAIPEQALFTLIYVLIVYWMVGFDSPFHSLYLSILLCVISTGSFGMIIGCFAANASESMQMMPMAFIPFILFSNFLVSLDQIPAFIRWPQWFNPFKYLIDALTITEFESQLHDYQCFATQTCQQDCLYRYNGDAFLQQIDAGFASTWGLDQFIDTYQQSVYVDWALLFVLVVGFRFITWLILVRRNGL
mmetsp:Transcript_64833/g.103157  ORF Transcript_64833/g.103157 Transcript_64833/m.103157 type:complete len:720 (+) Transcript_64833:91-2250(+)|eukprot:CAMPEP_0197079796 /NCGR_PEP_ID=MMETSP1384-20130603/213804_1 /TAXON_ID=29189 /ORGANISM="Ammonia sp." /LENGTH=719 /DNA_ID=CAMNT_0042518677 /DNA_START=63 /DNA_END=2222 /DNA_ORIENTATION=-